MRLAARFETMVHTLKRVLTIVLFMHGTVGLVTVVLLLITPELKIGEGRFHKLIHTIETFNFKWLILVFLVLAWLVPLFLFAAYRTAKTAGLEVEHLRGRVRHLLENRSIPVQVDVDSRVPVAFDEALRVPIDLTTKIDIHDEVEIETSIPLTTELPINTKIETDVLGLGSISIPIRARLPLEVTIPVKSKMQLSATGLPIHVNDAVMVKLPTVDVRMSSRIETTIDLMRNLERAEELLVGNEDKSEDQKESGSNRDSSTSSLE